MSRTHCHLSMTHSKEVSLRSGWGPTNGPTICPSNVPMYNCPNINEQERNGHPEAVIDKQFLNNYHIRQMTFEQLSC